MLSPLNCNSQGIFLLGGTCSCCMVGEQIFLLLTFNGGHEIFHHLRGTSPEGEAGLQ